MALQVWLPLNGNIKNLGLANVATSSIETVAYDNNGKIGKCFISGGSSLTLNGINLNNNLVDILNNSNGSSISVWIKPVGNHVHYNGTIISSGNWNGTNWTFGVSLDNSLVDVLCRNYNLYISCSIPVNEWTHLVGVYKDGVSKVYKNGVYIGLKTGLSTFASDASNTCVGRETYASGYFGFNGRINDLRVYDHALSEEEIHELSLGKVGHWCLDNAEIEPTINLGNVNSNYSTLQEGTIYNAGGWGGDTGTVTYYKHGGYNDGPYKVYHKLTTGSGGIYSKPDTDIVIESGKTYTMSIYVKSNRDFTDSNYSFNINRTSDNHYITAGSAVHFTTNWTRIVRTFTATSADAGVYGEMSIVYNDTVSDYYVYFSCFQIEEKNHATPYVDGTRTGYCPDISGYHNNLIVNGNPTLSNDSARYNKSTLFNGSNYLSCTSPTAEAKTLSLWAYIGSIPTSSSVLFADYKSKLSIGFYNSGTLIITRCADTSSTLGATTLVKTNSWNHFCVVNGATNLLYINGLAATMSGSNNWTHSTDTLMIGMRSAGTGFANKISDVRLYATALSADDILKLYKLGN